MASGSPPPALLMGEEGPYDIPFMSVMQTCGKIEEFIDEFFHFLARRTDFFLLMKHQNAKMGFPPGNAERMILQAFKKYEILTRKREAEILREEETRRIEAMTGLDDPTPLSSSPPPSSHLPPPPLPPSLPAPAPAPASDSNSQQGGSDPQATSASAATKETSKEESTQNGARSDKKKKKKATTDKPKKDPTDFNLSSDTYNGGVMDNYRWSQTMTDLEIRVPIPENTSAKQLKVEIANEHLKVVILKPERRVLLDGSLLKRIKVDDSMWSVEKETNTVYINLEKTKEVMWGSVFRGEKAIDLTKVDVTRNINEFDEEAQAAIERVTHDHHMKMLGKPTSGQEKAYDILKKAWDAPGSPFKGTPFDPSKVNVTGTW